MQKKPLIIQQPPVAITLAAQHKQLAPGQLVSATAGRTAPTFSRARVSWPSHIPSGRLVRYIESREV